MGIHVSRPPTSKDIQLKNEQSPKIYHPQNNDQPKRQNKENPDGGISYITSPYTKENKFIVNQ